MRAHYIAPLTLACLLSAAGCSTPITEPTARADQGITVGDTFNFGALAHPGSCPDAQAGGIVDGTRLQQYQCNGTGAQSYRLKDAGNGAFLLLNTAANKCVDVRWGGTANGTPIQLWDCNQTAAQTFTVQDAGDGFITFVNTTSNKCLDVLGDNPADDTIVQLFDCNG